MCGSLKDEAGRDLIEGVAPGWRAVFARLRAATERFLYEEKLVLIDETVADRDHAVAHVAAHLQLDHLGSPGDGFTDSEEEQANCLADIWLDRVDWTQAS